MKKTILITGWTGYIGSHWVVAFEQAGYKTVIVDNLVNSTVEAIDWIEKILGYKPDFFNIDLRNKEKLEEVFKKYDFDWVIHFAGLKAVWESCEKPLEYFDNNIVWSIKLFECMEKYSVKNIIFSSSATVYTSPQPSVLKEREQEQNWIKEDFITWNTTNSYWTTKFLLEQILIDLSKFSGFNVINLRYFNPVWAHESWFLWEDPEWIPNNLLPFIMKVASWELDELKVFGDDYETIDGTWVRDYIDVVDLIDGHLKSYEKITLWFNVYNLWVGKWTSVLEMLKIAEKVTWKSIKYKIEWRRSWDLAEVYCNPSKAKNELWWFSKTSLDDSISNSWRFYNKGSII